MNRRNFLMLSVAGAVFFAVQALCGQSTRTLIPSPTLGPAISSPAVLPTATTPLPSGTLTIGATPTSQSGHGSKENYYLYSDCKPVMGLSVTIDITKDIVSDIGFSFQLNAWSPEGANTVWQQYGIEFVTQGKPTLKAFPFVDNWASGTFLQAHNLGKGNLINHKPLMLAMPGNSLPAGYKITINLKNDSNDNVNGVTYTIRDNFGKSTTLDVELESLRYADSASTTKIPVTSIALAPINSFMLVLVGPVNGERADLSSGAGTFTYTATTPLNISNRDPQCTSARKTDTAETANSVYGTLSVSPGQVITQSFDTKAP